MGGSSEFGECDICGEIKPLQRKYFNYPIKCECHSPYHFEVVHHCNNCTPIEPKETTITLSTSYLKNIDQEIRKEKLKKLNNA
jgi:hypothetical protein